MRRRLGGIEGPRVASGLGAAVLATTAMSAALLGWLRWRASGGATVTTLGGVALGGGIYLLVLVLLRVPELRSLLAAVRRRLGRR